MSDRTIASISALGSAPGVRLTSNGDPTPDPTPERHGERPIDRAQWTRYSPGNKDRCMICSRKGDIQVVLTATEIGAGRGANLVTQRFVFCNDHGLLRFGDALGKLKSQSGRTDL
jgi:hypothetical protein